MTTQSSEQPSTNAAHWQQLDTLLIARPKLCFWWRDDDAIAATEALEALLTISHQCSSPLHLAVIPAYAEPSLVELLDRHPAHSRVLLHGYAHQNHAPAEQRKSEYSEQRLLSQVTHEIQTGRHRLATDFAKRFRPVFVPPWNRIAAEWIPVLAANGIETLSSRREQHQGLGLPTVDAHLDIINWSTNRFAGERECLESLCQLIHQRPAHEQGPLGILSHHLVHDASHNAFLTKLLTRLGQRVIAPFEH